MLNHTFYKGLKTYNKKKKIIFLVIRKQPGEIDWILPVLDNIKDKVNIITIFEKKISLKLLKQNETLYKIFLQTICCYFVNSKFKCLFLRLASKLSYILNINKAEIFFKKKIFQNYYKISDLLELLSLNHIILDRKNIRVGMQDFTDNSPWILKLKNEIKNCKIISYPHTTKIYSDKKNFLKPKNKKFGKNFLFLSSQNDLKHFENKAHNQYVYICGYPKYEKKWLRKIEKYSSFTLYEKINKKKNIFIAYKGFDDSLFNKNDYINQVKKLFDFVNTSQKYKLIFKFHPNDQQEKVFLKIANKYSKELWTITKSYLHTIIKNSTVCMSFYNNASITDFLAAGKLPIQLEKVTLNKNLRSTYSDLNLCLTLKNNLSIKKAVNLSLKKDKNLKMKIFFTNFDKFFRKKNSIYFTSSKILEIMK